MKVTYKKNYENMPDIPYLNRLIRLESKLKVLLAHKERTCKDNFLTGILSLCKLFIVKAFHLTRRDEHA